MSIITVVLKESSTKIVMTNNSISTLDILKILGFDESFFKMSPLMMAGRPTTVMGNANKLLEGRGKVNLELSLNEDGWHMEASAIPDDCECAIDVGFIGDEGVMGNAKQE